MSPAGKSGYKTVDSDMDATSAISLGYSIVEELASECRDAADNFASPDHPKAQAFSEAADMLEQTTEEDAPDGLGDKTRTVTYPEWVSRDKRRGASRAVRLENAIVLLSLGADALEGWGEEKTGEGEYEPGEEAYPGLQTYCDTIRDHAADLENVEFPGMYG